MNPFTFSNPIKEPERFIGRKAEIRQIVNRLLSSAHESTSIIGERRIGKTSLLNYLAHPDVSLGLGLTPDKFCLIYVDFQGLTDITPQRFWQRVLKMASRSICDENLKPSIEKLSERGEFDLFDLEDLFQSTMDKGLTIVLLMDEFEYVTENPNFKNDFFGGLRALAIHHGLALIPSTRRELVELCHSDEIKGSPFFNIFANVVLRPLSRAEVNEMLTGYVSGSEFAFTPEEKDHIWSLCGGYPFFAQMAAHYLFEGEKLGLSSEALTDFARTNFDQQADPHFNYLWSHCTENEKITLLVILALSLKQKARRADVTIESITRQSPRAMLDIVSLSKRGIIDEKEGRCFLFSPSFGHWIKQEIMALPGEEATPKTVKEWLQEGGKEKLIRENHLKSILPRVKPKYWPLFIEILKELSFRLAAEGVIETIHLLT